MGIWNTKFRKPAMIAGALAIALAANPVLAQDPHNGSKRGGAGFVSGAAIGAAAGGPVGAIVGATVAPSWANAALRRTKRSRRAMPRSPPCTRPA